MSNATLVRCGKCLACQMGYAAILCERPTEIVEKPDPRDVAKRTWYHCDIALQYVKRRRYLPWQIHVNGELVGEFGHFDPAWDAVLDLIAGR